MIISSATIIPLLIKHGYFFILPISVFEGPMISVIAGFLVAQGYYNFFAVYAVLILGDIIGDTLYFFLGRFGGKRFIRRWGRFIRLDEKKVNYLRKHFRKHGARTLVLGKLNALGSVILVAAGISDIGYLRFIVLNTIPTIFKTLVLVGLGYFFGYAYDTLERYINYAGLLSIVALALGIGVYFYIKHKR